MHNNLAKQMLYDFHRSQNKKQPHSLHATYLVTGTQSLPPQLADIESQDASDKSLQTSPAHQMPGSYRATSLLLVDEDNLDSQLTWSTRGCRHILLTSMQAPSLPSTMSCQYTSTVFSPPRSMYHQFIYLFLCGPATKLRQDLHILTECNRAIMAAATNEDLLETYKQYGVIRNGQAKVDISLDQSCRIRILTCHCPASLYAHSTSPEATARTTGYIFKSRSKASQVHVPI